MSNRAWVTLATNDSYGLGALVLAHSLRRAGSLYSAVVLITPSVTDAMRERLRAVFAEVVMVDVLDSKDAAHLALLQRPELGITFTKIHCWSLTQFEKCVFLDADTLIIQNCDELFEREELSAAPDVGWPDCFNSGVFVYKPSKETFEQLIKFAQERGSFDGGDQGLLNSFFSDWAHGDINKHLPFLYNVTSAAFYSYLPALKHYGQDLKIIHFIGIAKPWLQQFNWESRTVEAPEHIKGLLQLWWDLFVSQVHPQLDVTMGEGPPPPALPPHDVGQHYMPTVDPDSEFPWHHPDAQIQEDSQKEEFDLGEFHDPWEIYRGHIPSNQDESPSRHSFSGRVDDHEDMKKYAWEYKPQEFSTQHDHVEQTHAQSEYRYEDSQNHHHHSEHHWESHSHDQSAHMYHHQSYQQHWQQDYHHKDQSHQEEHFVYHYENKAHTNHALTDYHHDDHHSHYASTSDHQSHRHSHHSLHNHPHSDDTAHKDTDSDTGKLLSHRVDIVHHVRLDHETIVNLHKQKDHSEKSSEMINGDISDCESDYYEEIRPRHPYDGFYLRHRATIDVKGRKICSHELPPSPMSTPPPELQSDDSTPDFLPEEIPLTDDVKEQSGVAGNLARVVPGALGSQREALDELTRRQGWEAGNIDYMGADSFDNIWAKISQTLGQTRVSPPKQPSPPKEEPKQEAPAPAPVEVAQEAVTVDAAVPQVPAPATEAPAEAQAPGEAPAAVEAPAKIEAAPVAVPEAAAAVEAPAVVETAAKIQASPVEAAPAVEAPAAEAAAQPEPVAPADIPATVEAAAAPAPEAEPLPVESSEIPATVEAIAPGETPKSADVPVTVEAAAAPEVAKDEPKTETPALPPTPPVTPKSTPESTPVSESAPTLEPVEVQNDSAPAAPAEAPVAPAEAPAVPVEAPVAPVEAPAALAVAPAAPVEASAVPVEAPAAPSEAPAVPVEAPAAPVDVTAAPEVPAPVEAPVAPTPVEAAKVTPVVASEAPAPAEAPKDPVEVKKEIPVPVEAAKDPAPAVETQKEAPAPVEAPKDPEPAAATPASPGPAAEAPASPEASAAKPEATPKKPSEAPSLSASTDSPPLANTPSKEEPPALPTAKSEERRKAVGKLQLSPPAVADPLPTPESELEDAAALAQSIIASELSTPTVTEASPVPQAEPAPPAQDKRLAVEEPQVPTPPVGAVSLEQIGVKAAPKSKPTTAAQIESSVSDKSAPASPTDAPKDAPKKKVIKKVKKESAATGGAGADAPVPPPRKKEKKPKEK